jgi:hypothetical protein
MWYVYIKCLTSGHSYQLVVERKLPKYFGTAIAILLYMLQKYFFKIMLIVIR